MVMNNNNTDIFEGVNKKKGTNSTNLPENRNLDSNNNFFLFESQAITPIKSFNTESNRRLNDYDFNLLKEDAYKDVSDDLFKLEYKISRIEDEIKALDSQIQAARDISDFDLVSELVSRKKIAEEDYEALVAIYNDRSISAKISDSISNILGIKIKTGVDSIKGKINNFSEILISKLPKRFSSVLELKKSLTKLQNINKSVDELMSMNIPYGENINKYEQLSKYIIRANSIQSEISHYLK